MKFFDFRKVTPKEGQVVLVYGNRVQMEEKVFGFAYWNGRVFAEAINTRERYRVTMANALLAYENVDYFAILDPEEIELIQFIK